eukprot:Protomagalhaensia_sp_Gyna_25__180@NODE_1088_length_2203_cov_155_078096_g13_i1_p1_GENE_NODE_1088_length_2203_cov_155_078096_g13_i1NODE_1088_length_2203_cov_155_078096_g13_i1_p1_ORF_typecomplete_len561_score83_15GDPD/PF03009_17/4_5e12GDPD/PF03009_17/2_1e06PBD/PF00786_28/6_2e03PBD/PF00786_28/0_5_NODE_1088_length_2203_cov_155_078096_g13_i13282010
MTPSFPLLVLVVAFVGQATLCPHIPFGGRKPLVIAHRGGDLSSPASSLAGYQHTMTIASADFLECDLTTTRDGVLICQHEPDLSKSTNAESPQFRHIFKDEDRSKEQLDPVFDFKLGGSLKETRESYLRADCRPRNSWFTPDYDWNGTLAQLSARCLAHQTCDSSLRHMPVVTLDELWMLASEQAKRREEAIRSGASVIPREIGLYLEVKHSTWHQSRRDRDLVAIVLSYLAHHSRSNVDAKLEFGFPLYLQSFEIVDLIRFRQHIGYDHPEVKLIGLSSSLRTLFNLPPDSCAETEDAKEYLTKLMKDAIQSAEQQQEEANVSPVPTTGGLLSKAWDDCVDYDHSPKGDNDLDSAAKFLRQEGSFGEMFVGVARLPITYGDSLDPHLGCKKPKDRPLEERFLATTRIKPEQNCGKECDSINVGLKMVPIGLSRAEAFTTSNATSDLRTSICQQELERVLEALYITCPTDQFSSTYVLDTAGQTSQAFDISCFADAIGIHLDFLLKHPNIAEEAGDRCVPLHVWTVKTEGDLRAAMQLGVQGVITDNAVEASSRILREWT